MMETGPFRIARGISAAVPARDPGEPPKEVESAGLAGRVSLAFKPLAALARQGGELPTLAVLSQGSGRGPLVILVTQQRVEGPSPSVPDRRGAPTFTAHGSSDFRRACRPWRRLPRSGWCRGESHRNHVIAIILPGQN
jgi:hypothetical protein